MNKELVKSVSESLLKLRFMAVSQFLKPMKEAEREKIEFPPGCMHVLGWLKSKGQPVSMSDLASASLISRPNLTTMVDRLCADGLVERLADVHDRRIVNVALTEKGEELMKQHKEHAVTFIASRLSLLEDEELEKLKRAMDDMIEVLEVITAKQSYHLEKMGTVERSST